MAKRITVAAIRALAESCRRLFPSAPWLTVGQFNERSRSEPWVIVDTRRAEERDISIIPGAISEAEFEQRAETIGATPVLVYCAIGCHSAAVSLGLVKRGFAAHDLVGGIMYWALASQRLTTPSGEPTRRLHVHSPAWKSAISGYETIA